MLNNMDKETLYRFFEGRASLEEGEQIRAWTEESSGNEEDFFKERRLFDAMMLLARQGKEGLHVQWASVTKELLKIAGVILLTLSVSCLYRQHDMSTDTQAMRTIHAPAGQRMNTTLPGGTDEQFVFMTRRLY